MENNSQVSVQRQMATERQQAKLKRLLVRAREVGRGLPFLPVEALSKSVASNWIEFLEAQLPPENTTSEHSAEGVSA